MWSKENSPPLSGTSVFNSKENTKNQLSWKNIDFSTSRKKQNEPQKTIKKSSQKLNKVFQDKSNLTKNRESIPNLVKPGSFLFRKSSFKKQLPSAVKRVSFYKNPSFKKEETAIEDEEEMQICMMYEQSRHIIQKNSYFHGEAECQNFQTKHNFVKGENFMRNEQNYSNNSVPQSVKENLNQNPLYQADPDDHNDEDDKNKNKDGENKNNDDEDDGKDHNNNYDKHQSPPKETFDVLEDFINSSQNYASNLFENSFSEKKKCQKLFETNVLKSIENISKKTEPYNVNKAGSKVFSKDRENSNKNTLDLALYKHLKNKNVGNNQETTSDIHTSICSKLEAIMSICKPFIVHPMSCLLKGFSNRHCTTIRANDGVFYEKNISPIKHNTNNLKLVFKSVKPFPNQKNVESYKDSAMLPFNSANHNHLYPNSQKFEKVIILSETLKNVRCKKAFLMPLVRLNHTNEQITNELYISSKALTHKDSNIDNQPAPKPVKTFTNFLITESAEKPSFKPVVPTLCRMMASRRILAHKPSICVRHHTIARHHKLKCENEKTKKNKIFMFKPSLKNLRKKIAYLKKRNFFLKTKYTKPKNIKDPLKLRFKIIKKEKSMNQCQSNKGDTHNSKIDFKKYLKSFKTSSFLLFNKIPKFSKKKEEEENRPVLQETPADTTSRFNKTPKLFPNQMFMDIINSQFNKLSNKTPPPVPKPSGISGPAIATKPSKASQPPATQVNPIRSKTILRSLISSLKQNSQYNNKTKQIQSFNRHKISEEIKPLLLHPLYGPSRPDPPLKYNSFINENNFKK